MNESQLSVRFFSACGLRTWQTWTYLVPFPKLTAISVENRKIFAPSVFCALWRGSPGIGYRRWGSKTRM